MTRVGRTAALRPVPFPGRNRVALFPRDGHGIMLAALSCGRRSLYNGRVASRHADWLRQADADLRHARHARAGGAHEWACFAAQQAAEKSLKAVLTRRGADGRVAQ